MFGGYVFVDEIPKHNSNKGSVYFFTRPFNLTLVKYRDDIRIYTTAQLKAVMTCNAKVRKTIKEIDDKGNKCTINLPDNESINVNAYWCESYTLNVILLFEYKGAYSLYCGRYNSDNDILEHKSLVDLFRKKKINDLYIDMDDIRGDECNSRKKACNDINNLIKEHDGYKFHMLIDGFGYEDLLMALAKKAIHIYLDPQSAVMFEQHKKLWLFCSNRERADIILTNGLKNDPDQNKNIDIVLTNEETESIDKKHYFIKYPIRSTLQDVHFIRNLTAPERIIPIGTRTEIPEFILKLCRTKIDSSVLEKHNGKES